MEDSTINNQLRQLLLEQLKIRAEEENDLESMYTLGRWLLEDVEFPVDLDEGIPNTISLLLLEY